LGAAPFFLLLSAGLRFSNRFNNQPHLNGSEASGIIRHPHSVQIYHQLGLQGYPLHELAPGSRAAQVGAIQECQFCLSVHAVMKCFHVYLLIM